MYRAQIKKNKLKFRDKAIYSDNVAMFDIGEVLFQKTLKEYKKMLEKYLEKKVINKILPHSKKVFGFFMKKKIEEVLLIIKKSSDKGYNIEFKVLPTFYNNKKYIDLARKNLVINSKEGVSIISLKSFYLKNMKCYVPDSGGSIS